MNALQKGLTIVSLLTLPLVGIADSHMGDPGMEDGPMEGGRMSGQGMYGQGMDEKVMDSEHKEGADKSWSNLRGVHPMTGTVRAVNHQTGEIELVTSVAPLRLHFPPPSLKGVEKGDRLTVKMGHKTAVDPTDITY